jgi:uncharacterized protein (TIGR03792 family)
MTASMVIEELVFEVAAEHQEAWLERDREAWNPFFASRSGYVRREVWRPLDRPEEVLVHVWWESLEAWQAVPREEVAAVERQLSDRHRPCTTRALQLLDHPG